MAKSKKMGARSPESSPYDSIAGPTCSSGSSPWAGRRAERPQSGWQRITDSDRER